MRYTTDDLRIKEIRELTPPAHLIREFPCEEPFAEPFTAPEWPLTKFCTVTTIDFL